MKQPGSSQQRAISLADSEDSEDDLAHDDDVEITPIPDASLSRLAHHIPGSSASSGQPPMTSSFSIRAKKKQRSNEGGGDASSKVVDSLVTSLEVLQAQNLE